MSWTFHAAAGHGDGGVSSPTVAVTLTGISAGDLIVLGVKWEGGDVAVTCGDGTSSLTEWPAGHKGGDPWLTMFYLLGSVATGSVTYTVTFGSSLLWRGVTAMAYTPSAGTVSLDGTPTGAIGTGSSIASGNITTTGTDGVAFGSYSEYGDPITGTPTINGVALEQSITDASTQSQRDTLWSRRYSAGFTGQAAGAILNPNNWSCGVMAFNLSGGAPPEPRLIFNRQIG